MPFWPARSSLLSSETARKFWRGLLLLTLILTAAASVSCAPLFSDNERSALVAFWNLPGRYTISLSKTATQKGPFQAGLTTDASRWLLAYQNAATLLKSTGGNPSTEWDPWLQQRMAWDRSVAQATATALNTQLGFPAASKTSVKTPPVLPAPIPESLLMAVGNPPPLIEIYIPHHYIITLPDNNGKDETFNYDDHVLAHSVNPYYRHDQGVVAYGQSLQNMPIQALSTLMAAAGLSPSAQRICIAVSLLEGGFDSVNTYDTGGLSVGFIQFITSADGKGSLSDVLLREKIQSPVAFASDFHNFGVDVTDDGTLVVVDPDTGAELQGADAVMEVISDKRLTAVFQRAGQCSQAFRIAQIQTARALYWPADDPFTAVVNSQTVQGKVSDIIKSEAGIATLFDRKVNKGSIGSFGDTISRVAAEHQAITLAELIPYEQEIITAMKYRANFLKDPTLSQPPALPLAIPATPATTPPVTTPSGDEVLPP